MTTSCIAGSQPYSISTWVSDPSSMHVPGRKSRKKHACKKHATQGSALSDPRRQLKNNGVASRLILSNQAVSLSGTDSQPWNKLERSKQIAEQGPVVIGWLDINSSVLKQDLHRREKEDSDDA